MSAEVTDELPEGWAYSTVDDVSQSIQYGHTASAIHSENGPRFLRITDIQNGKVDWNQVPTCELDSGELEKYQLRAGDIVFARTGATTGKSFLIRECPTAIFASYLIRLRSTPAVESGFLSLFFQTSTYWGLISDNVSGNAQPNCNASKLGALPMPIPPLAEQRRIVAAVEAVLAKVNAARDRLNRVPAILKRFRQAVLSAACSGRLTADWREKNPPEVSTPAFRERLLTQRRNRLSGTNGRYRDPVSADADYLDDVPDGWGVFSVDELTSTVTSGSRDWSQYYGRGTGTFLMAQNVRPGKLDLSFRQEVDPPEGDRDRARSQVEVGDVLVTIVGANTGDVCYVDRALPGHYVCQSVALMRPLEPEYAPYLNHYLNSPRHGRGQYEGYIYGEGRPHLSFDHIKMTAIALPQLAEQQEIVRRVGGLFALVDAIEARLTDARQMADQLTQAVLAKAFRGELVPTEAALARRENRTYEPAADLLARIRAEREKDAAANGKPTRTRKPRRAAGAED